MRFAILKHDYAIACAALSRSTKRTSDLLTILVVLPLSVVFIRAWLSGLTGNHREHLALGMSLLIAAVLTKTLLERVWFHQSEGALAHFAQRSGEWLGYIVPLFASGIVVGLVGMATIGIFHPPSAILGTVGGIAIGLALPFVRERLHRRWRSFALSGKITSSRPQHALIISAAISAVAGLICAFLPRENYLDAGIAGSFALVVSLVAGRVDAAIVRYMTLMGHSSMSLLRHWLPLQCALLLPLLAVLLIAQSWVPAGVTALIFLCLLSITTLRIYAYRATSRLIADWWVTGVIFATAYAALTLPPIGPIIAIVAIAWLAQRGLASRWLLE